MEVRELLPDGTEFKAVWWSYLRQSEPCYEAETVQFLREVKERAEQGDVAWLKKRGRGYAAVEAA